MTATKIEWATEVWNPVTGCSRVSAGCDNCYAVRMSHRLEGMGQEPYTGLTVLNGKGDRHFNGVVRCHEDRLEIPLRWRKPRRVFVNSMSDLFHPAVPFEFIDRVFAVMALTPHITYMILTKRPERAVEHLRRRDSSGYDTPKRIEYWMVGGRGTDKPFTIRDRWPLPNVWLGTSVEDQAAADERIPHLLRCPAAVRFLSCEPLLGPVDLHDAFYHTCRDCCDEYETHPLDVRVDWIIAGGESGPAARACDIDWLRSIVRQCDEASAAVFVKQLGKWIGGSPDGFTVQRWLLESDGKTGVWHPPVIKSQLHPELFDAIPENAIAFGLKCQKGGDMSEWPEQLRRREFPQEATA